MNATIMLIILGLSSRTLTQSHDIHNHNNDGSNNYYIYNTQINTTVYYCHTMRAAAADDYCEKNELGETVNVNETLPDKFIGNCILLIHKTSDYKIKNDSKNFVVQFTNQVVVVILCKYEARTDILANLIYLRSNTCFYTEPFCNGSLPGNKEYVYWANKSYCTSLEVPKVTFQFRELQNASSSQYIIGSYRNHWLAVEVLDNKTLCHTDIWESGEPGIYISNKLFVGATESNVLIDRYLPKWKENCDALSCQPPLEDTFAQSRPNQPGECEITDLQRHLVYLTVSVALCVLMAFIISLFNIWINFTSIKKAMRHQRAGSKLTILRCLSHSLTTQYLFLREEEAAKHSAPSNQQLYETVENDLYIK